jgi:methylmalonyl-CoA/ethylmalonyl-CoA epimerase
MIRNFGHIGVMVKDLDQAIEAYTKGLGMVLEKRTENPDLKQRAGLLRLGTLEIELLEFRDPDLPVPRAIHAGKPGLNHFCIEVSQLDETIRELEAKGFQLIEGFPRQGIHGRIAFVSPPHAPDERIELLEVE